MIQAPDFMEEHLAPHGWHGVEQSGSARSGAIAPGPLWHVLLLLLLLNGERLVLDVVAASGRSVVVMLLLLPPAVHHHGGGFPAACDHRPHTVEAHRPAAAAAARVLLVVAGAVVVVVAAEVVGVLAAPDELAEGPQHAVGLQTGQCKKSSPSTMAIIVPNFVPIVDWPHCAYR